VETHVSDRHQVAIVTGAGIGRGIAEVFAQAGAAVVVSDLTAEKADAVAQGIRAGGGKAAATACNVTDDAALAALVDFAIGQFGKVTILVNNAGGGGPKPFDMPMSDFEWAYKLNVFSVFNLTQLCAPHMEKAGGGAVLNISSMAGENKNVRMASYASSKAAENHLTRNVAFDLGPEGIRVNAIAPGAIRTDALASCSPRTSRRRCSSTRRSSAWRLPKRHRDGRAVPLLERLGVGQRPGAHRQRRRRAGTRLTPPPTYPLSHRRIPCPTIPTRSSQRRSPRRLRVIITGAGGAIGGATAHVLAAAGANVVVSDLNLEAEKVAADVAEGTGRETLAIRTDVTSEAEQQALVDATLAKFGKITALINNVGWGEYTPLWDVSMDYMVKSYMLNTVSAYTSRSCACRT
jgi:7-alpha-hydroxysteroid dehydrogenase